MRCEDSENVVVERIVGGQQFRPHPGDEQDEEPQHREDGERVAEHAPPEPAPRCVGLGGVLVVRRQVFAGLGDGVVGEGAHFSSLTFGLRKP